MRQATPATASSTKAAQAHLAVPALLSASTLIGNDVCNLQDEDLGSIDDIMLDTSSDSYYGARTDTPRR